MGLTGDMNKQKLLTLIANMATRRSCPHTRVLVNTLKAGQHGGSHQHTQRFLIITIEGRGMSCEGGDFAGTGRRFHPPAPPPSPQLPEKKRHLLSLFIGTLSTPASLCVKMRAGIQKTCTDGASSLSASSSPPSRSFRSSTGAQAQRQLGFFLLHTSSRSLSSLPSSLLPTLLSSSCYWRGRCQETDCAVPPED